MLGEAIGGALRAVFVAAFFKPLYQWLRSEISFGRMLARLACVFLCWLLTLAVLFAMLMALLHSMAQG
ncbi:hypothetical protein D3871_02810 [Noviherbaspirillum saxi]|uniref:Uncharacterized protein n=2 Tax=Noviherbaspirillum saxi TaxID=2320863 RepID=A0A3A3FNI9_9BURK|nr:hypothetical protein D3871_02810 [Noviherbaspirillum saxi]